MNVYSTVFVRKKRNVIDAFRLQVIPSFIAHPNGYEFPFLLLNLSCNFCINS